eukprot:6196534-Pleurochrysis_carterae.AAC.2
MKKGIETEPRTQRRSGMDLGRMDGNEKVGKKALVRACVCARMRGLTHSGRRGCSRQGRACSPLRTPRRSRWAPAARTRDMHARI